MSTILSLCAAAAANVGSAGATGVMIDFESLAPGTVVTNQLAGQGVSSVSATGGSGDAMVFDSANPTGGDTDLATPVTGTVGPGADNVAYGNILIISTDGDSGDPDDHAGGGSIFMQLSFVADFLDVHVIDIEENGGSVELLFEEPERGGSGVVATLPLVALGDNSLQRVTSDGVEFNAIRFNLVGSGSVADIEVVPTPGTIACGLLGVGAMIRRRR